MKLFVLTYLFDPCDGDAWTMVIGVYSDEDYARNVMDSKFDTAYGVLGITKQDVERHCVSIKIGETKDSIHFNGDKHVWEITETEI
jgi:hypothetical protein